LEGLAQRKFPKVLINAKDGRVNSRLTCATANLLNRLDPVPVDGARATHGKLDEAATPSGEGVEPNRRSWSPARIQIEIELKYFMRHNPENCHHCVLTTSST
jgi:hypothetical protein